MIMYGKPTLSLRLSRAVKHRLADMQGGRSMLSKRVLIDLKGHSFKRVYVHFRVRG